MERTIIRIQRAISELDLGISEVTMRGDTLVFMNQALRMTGGVQVPSLDDESALIRAMLHLEAAI